MKIAYVKNANLSFHHQLLLETILFITFLHHKAYIIFRFVYL